MGPFWCERDKSWVRFIIEKNQVRAEIARTSNSPRLTTDWEPADKDSWPTSYDENGKVEQIFYSLKEGILYRTAGNINSWTDQLVSMVYGENGQWKQYNIVQGNPFTNYEKEALSVLTPYEQLPLTPERAAQERALEETRIRQAVEAERLKWESYKSRDIRYLGLEAAGEGTLFDKDTLNVLFNELTGALLGFHISQYSNCQDYLTALKMIIEDPNCEFHQNILNLASRTDVDRELNLDEDEAMRQTLLAHKKTFYFNLLREEVGYLSREFNINCPLLNPEEIAISHEPEWGERSGASVYRFPDPKPLADESWDDYVKKFPVPALDFSSAQPPSIPMNQPLVGLWDDNDDEFFLGSDLSSQTSWSDFPRTGTVADFPVWRAVGSPTRVKVEDHNCLAATKENRRKNTLDDFPQEHRPLVEESSSCSLANISMMVLGGFIAAVGISAVALALVTVTVNPLTFGLTIGLGSAAILAGLGLFAVGAYRTAKASTCMEPDPQQDGDTLLFDL